MWLGLLCFPCCRFLPCCRNGVEREHFNATQRRYTGPVAKRAARSCYLAMDNRAPRQSLAGSTAAVNVYRAPTSQPPESVVDGAGSMGNAQLAVQDADCIEITARTADVPSTTAGCVVVIAFD